MQQRPCSQRCPIALSRPGFRQCPRLDQIPAIPEMRSRNEQNVAGMKLSKIDERYRQRQIVRVDNARRSGAAGNLAEVASIGRDVSHFQSMKKWISIGRICTKGWGALSHQKNAMMRGRNFSAAITRTWTRHIIGASGRFAVGRDRAAVSGCWGWHYAAWIPLPTSPIAAFARERRSAGCQS